jgi:hypothetical protein
VGGRKFEFSPRSTPISGNIRDQAHVLVEQLKLNTLDNGIAAKSISSPSINSDKWAAVSINGNSNSSSGLSKLIIKRQELNNELSRKLEVSPTNKEYSLQTVTYDYDSYPVEPNNNTETNRYQYDQEGIDEIIDEGESKDDFKPLDLTIPGSSNEKPLPGQKCKPTKQNVRMSFVQRAVEGNHLFDWLGKTSPVTSPREPPLPSPPSSNKSKSSRNNNVEVVDQVDDLATNKVEENSPRTDSTGDVETDASIRHHYPSSSRKTSSPEKVRERKSTSHSTTTLGPSRSGSESNYSDPVGPGSLTIVTDDNPRPMKPPRMSLILSPRASTNPSISPRFSGDVPVPPPTKPPPSPPRHRQFSSNQ